MWTLCITIGIIIGFVVLNIDVFLGNPNAIPVPVNINQWFISVIMFSILMTAMVQDLKKKS